MEYFKFIQSEWAVISQAPFTFVALAIVCYSVCWLWFRARLKMSSELNNLKDQRIEEYKSKTGTSSPDEALKRIQALESGLEEKLTDGGTTFK